MIFPIDLYVSAWGVNYICDIWRKTFSPTPSTYATFSLPPVPVLQPLFFQHLSARFRLTFFSDRPNEASAMFRAVLLPGRSLALNSAFLRVFVFAWYFSPKPPFDPAELPPCPAATSTRVITSSATSGTTRSPLDARPLRPCIVSPFVT